MIALLRFAPLFARQRRRLTLSLLLSLVTLACGIALLGLSGWFLTAAALSTLGAAFNLFGPSAGVRGLSFVRILTRYGEKLSGHDATLRLLSDIRQWLFGRLFPIVPLTTRLFGRAELVSRLTADVDALDTAFLLALGPIATTILTGTAMSLGLHVVLPGASLPYALCYGVAALALPVILVTASRRAALRVAEAGAAVRAHVLDSLDGHQDLVLFGELDEAATGLEAAASHLAAEKRRLGSYGTLATGSLQLLAGGALVGTLLAGLDALQRGSIDGPLLAGVLLGVVASFEASAGLLRGASRLAAAVASAERLDALRTEPLPVVEPLRPTLLPPGGALTFRHVGFGYAGRRSVLDDLSFSLRSGECAALVGPSGAGKSTVAQLALKLQMPTSGQILVNGVDLAAVRSGDLHQRVTLMTQDAPVFLDTVRNNLLIGNPEADDEALWSVLRAVRLDDFVRSLPSGLESPLGEAGQTLSSGQARRLSLARTLLSTASVIILDEPTSGLDRPTELAFLADLPAIAGGRTLLVITHAALPPGVFDRVLSLRAGRLTEANSSPVSGSPAYALV